ncbi:helix-turn-helix domain-containing protein [Sedimentitalea sp. JM2-8]|uniref:Helix-turn-helix domain-containing protein n=1 Tax=Sedimentitalea xiamensis TaxID=3050037 RepID=A0ABT7FJ79_9RHOB|nr:helix-turn-helix domain-containing protein [Sedimentitalea xiamensis]MDK3075171.1 helix-turn-helix domain-containing protein [Sedimentitalea xiamensis]
MNVREQLKDVPESERVEYLLHFIDYYMGFAVIPETATPGFTLAETVVLNMLTKHSGDMVRHSTIVAAIARVTGREDVDTPTKVFISKIRRKLREQGNPLKIRNIRNYGYMAVAI